MFDFWHIFATYSASQGHWLHVMNKHSVWVNMDRVCQFWEDMTNKSTAYFKIYSQMLSQCTANIWKMGKNS